MDLSDSLKDGIPLIGSSGPPVRAQLNDRIANIPAIGEEYARQCALSDRFAAREAASSLDRLAPFRVEPLIFQTPPETAFIRVAVRLHGQGTACIGGISLTRSQIGLPVPLANGAFADGLSGWSVETAGGTAALQRIDAEQKVLSVPGVTPAPERKTEGAAAYCLRVEHESEEALTELRYAKAIPVQGGNYYSLQTELSLEAPLAGTGPAALQRHGLALAGHSIGGGSMLPEALRKAAGEQPEADIVRSGGICAEVAFCDRTGRPLPSVKRSLVFNRATPTTWPQLMEAAGADANRYLVEGKSEYAERAKRKLLYMLADMIHGMDIFRRDGWHDDDCYGAVHIGRGLAVGSVIYAQTAGADIWSGEDRRAVLEQLRYIVSLMTDTAYYRFDLDSYPDEKGGKRSNWNADRATGLGVYALLFPDETAAEDLLRQALEVVDWQLEHVVDRDGAWPENVRYHGAVLHRYFLFFALLKQRKGIDYFRDSRVKGMYRFLIGVATEGDALQGNGDAPRLLTPAVGDANVNEQWFRLLGYAAPFYEKDDPQLAGEMAWAWKRAGAPVRDAGATSFLPAALLFPRPDLAEVRPDYRSARYADIGYVIFRGGAEAPGHYAIYEASPLTYHAHFDEGHFSIWAEGIPVTLDSGTGGYYNGDRHWYISAAAHNVVQFAGKDGAYGSGPLRSECLETFFSPQLDYVRSAIPDEGAERYERHFLFVKAGFNVYVVWDRIEGGTGSLWNLHTLSTGARIADRTVDAACLGGMGLRVHMAEPAMPSVSVSEGAVSSGYPLAAQQHFRVGGEAGADYLALLHPHAEGTLPLLAEPLYCGPLPDEVRLYQAAMPDGRRFVIALNGSAEEQRVCIPDGKGLKPLGGTRFPAGAGPEDANVASGLKERADAGWNADHAGSSGEDGHAELPPYGILILA